MFFSRIIYSAIGLGIVCGLVLSILQITSVNPLIFAAEQFESAPSTELAQSSSAENGSYDSHGHSHDHSHDGWAPEDGFERTLATIVSNMLATMGFAALLLALMNQFRNKNNQPMRYQHGLLWGLAGFVALFVAPGIGLPPEIPGIQAAPVEHRQMWWILTAISVGIGLGVLTFAHGKVKVIGLGFLALPYLVGAPSIEGPEFIHPNSDAVSSLVELHGQFIVFSGVANLIFWLVLGAASAYVINRWFLPLSPSESSDSNDQVGT